MYLICSGEIFFTGDDTQLGDLSAYQCSTGWEIEVGSPAFDPATDLDPVLIAGAVGAGLFCLVPPWAALLGLRFLFKAII